MLMELIGGDNTITTEAINYEEREAFNFLSTFIGVNKTETPF